MDLFEDKVGWHEERDKNGIKVKYKYPKETPTISLMMEAEIDIPCKIIIALANETEFFNKFTPFIHESYELK